MKELILQIKNLHATTAGKSILKGVNLEIFSGEVHALMGPNGSGKSTLSNVLMGHPNYTITEGEIFFRGKNLLDLKIEERSKAGLFLCFQYPVALPGVTVGSYLKTILKSSRGKEISAKEFKTEVLETMKSLEMNQSFLSRYVNDGFSGGEKKRNEILQMSLLKPTLAVLDETDSGLDIDALRIISEGINRYKNSSNAILLITHYQRMLNYITPDFVHIFADGKIQKTSDKNLAIQLEETGYEKILQEVSS